MTKKDRKPEIARVDTATLDVGLFKLRSKNADPVKGQVLKKQRDDLLIEYASTYALNDVDLRIFVAALSLAEIQRDKDLFKKPKEKDKPGTQLELFDDFKTTGEATGMEAGYALISAYELATAAGLGWGSRQVKRISDSLTRMSNVRMTMRMEDRVMSGANMLSFAHLESKKPRDANIAIAISPHFAKALLGEARMYVQYSLTEMHQLQHPASVLIHSTMTSRLSLSSKRPVRTTTIKIDTLIDAIYEPTDSKAKYRDRRRNIKPALEELNNLPDWNVELDKDTLKITIQRTLHESQRKPKSVTKRKSG